MFAEIILHRRVPKQFESFTYRIPENTSVKLGQIVKVPFRKQKLSGIVRTIHQKTPSYPTKLIEEISELILPDWQMQLATWMSERYKCSFAKVIALFVPEKVWPRLRPRSARAMAGKWAFQPSKPLLQYQKENVGAPLGNLTKNLLASPTPKLLLEETPLPRAALYQSLINAIPRDSQILFLFPEVFFLKQLAPQGAAHFHGDLPELKKASLWHAVGNCETRIIAALRTGMFLPFKKLGAIVLDFEHNENYNEKRVPHYHVLEVAEKISELRKIPLITISSTPRVETWHKIKTNEYEKYEWNEPSLKTTISLIDMADERRSGNYGIFAERVIPKIAACLARDLQVLLFINRTGVAGALLCRDCGNIFRCESCSSALTVHAEGTLVCQKCKKKIPVPAACNACGNIKLKSLGFGTERLEKEIKSIFGKARVLRLDRETISRKKYSSLNEKNLNAADILITTQIIDKPILLPQLELCIAVMPDPLLHFPDFRSTERVFQLLTHIRHLLRKKGEMIIQTFMPEHALWKYMTENRIEDFYASELETRKSLSLPPFNRL